MPYHFYSKIHEKVGTPVNFAQVARYWINTAETLQRYCRDIAVNIKLCVQLSFAVW